MVGFEGCWAGKTSYSFRYSNCAGYLIVAPRSLSSLYHMQRLLFKNNYCKSDGADLSKSRQTEDRIFISTDKEIIQTRYVPRAHQG